MGDDNYSWMLGDDYDCDTCGYTWNEVRFENWDEDENIWQLWMSVGCYGGEAVFSNDEKFAIKADAIINDCLTYELFTDEYAENLRKIIKEKV